MIARSGRNSVGVSRRAAGDRPRCGRSPTRWTRTPSGSWARRVYDLASAGAARASAVAAVSAVRVRMWRRIRRGLMSRTAIGVVGRRLERGRSLPRGPGHAFAAGPAFPLYWPPRVARGERRRARRGPGREPRQPAGRLKERRTPPMPEAVTTTARRVCPARAGHGILERGGPVPQEPMKTPHPTSPHAMHPRRRTALASSGRAGRRGRLALAGALVLLVLLGAAGPAPPSPASTRSRSAATAGATASACRSGAPTATPSTAGPTRPSSSTTTPASRSRTSPTRSIRVNLRSGLERRQAQLPQRLHRRRAPARRGRSRAGRPRPRPRRAAATRSSPAPCARPSPAAPTFTPTTGSLRLITKTDLGDDGAYRGTIKVVARAAGS